MNISLVDIDKNYKREDENNEIWVMNVLIIKISLEVGYDLIVLIIYLNFII